MRVLVVHGVKMDPVKGLGRMNEEILSSIIDLWLSGRFEKILLTKGSKWGPAWRIIWIPN